MDGVLKIRFWKSQEKQSGWQRLRWATLNWLFGAVEPSLVFSDLFEGLQIMIDSDQKKAICPLRC
jgi:hypothetical protein